MHRLLVLYPPPQSPEHFRDYYLKFHLPLAAKLPGLKKSRHAFDVAGMGGESPYFCVWEGDFESLDALTAAMASDVGQQVAADVPNYATGGAILLQYSPVESNK